MTPEEMLILLRAVAQRDLLAIQNNAMREEIENLKGEVAKTTEAPEVIPVRER